MSLFYTQDIIFLVAHGRAQHGWPSFCLCFYSWPFTLVQTTFTKQPSPLFLRVSGSGPGNVAISVFLRSILVLPARVAYANLIPSGNYEDYCRWLPPNALAMGIS